MTADYTPDDIMTIVAARSLADHATCLVGIGLPSEAANLARQLHAPNLVLIYESGTIGSKPDVLPLSVGDGELAETADVVVSMPELFAYWLQGGRIDVGFLGAAQIDRLGNLNSTVIGPYATPRVRLPGAGGAPEIAASVGEVFVIARHRPETFVLALDFVTTAGRRRPTWGPESSGTPRRGVTRVITDLGVLERDDSQRALVLTQVHPGVSIEMVRQATGWPLVVSPVVAETAPPSKEELHVLRGIRERTERAHAQSSTHA